MRQVIYNQLAEAYKDLDTIYQDDTLYLSELCIFGYHSFKPLVRASCNIAKKIGDCKSITSEFVKLSESLGRQVAHSSWAPEEWQVLSDKMGNVAKALEKAGEFKVSWNEECMDLL